MAPRTPAAAHLTKSKPEILRSAQDDKASASERTLMEAIHQRYGALITYVCRKSSIPEAFIAALIANESGRWAADGNPTPARFEKHVLRKLREVRDGMRKDYAGLTLADLKDASEEILRADASSWGLTQIMGYHVIKNGFPPFKLNDPEVNLTKAIALLRDFAGHFQLDVTREFEEMFRCWNSGAPYDDPKTPRIEGKTHDPKYVEKGLARMGIYEELGSGSQDLGETGVA